METETSLPFSYTTEAGRYPEQVDSSSHAHTLFTIFFSVIL